jgi:hypothetical protein
VHVSVTFTYDKAFAEYLAEQWKHVAPVKVGGVAYGDRGAEFVPGRYIRPGYVFTSRGCPRRCWFCSVWKRDPVPRLLPLVDGWNILGDNLLACPRDHVQSVFSMLRRQNRRIEFTGGLEALSLQDYQVEVLASLRPRPTMFFAYDPMRSRRCNRRRAVCWKPASQPPRISCELTCSSASPRIRSPRPSSACSRCARSASRRMRCSGVRRRRRR